MSECIILQGGRRESAIVAAAIAAGAHGIWQLTGVQPFIAYGGFGAGPDALDLSTAARVLIIHLPHDADTDTAPGLTTFQPTAGYCRMCGCSDANACELPNGEVCSRVEPTLCSRCKKED